MNVKNYSLDWIQQAASTQSVAPTVDPWVEAVKYYAPHILKTLQEAGSQTVAALLAKIQTELNVPQLQEEQFVGVIDRMILNKQLTVITQGGTPGAATVGLPVSPPP
jgi:glutamate racemase